MKKNISINISGIIFHIEEDGYETLKKYLDSINKYFASYEDSAEILADIESRIAEILLSKLNEGKQVITLADVKNLMTTMGSVSDFKAAEEAHEQAEREETRSSSSGPSSDTSSGTTAPPKRLYRDVRRKILGGVCSGMATYFDIDAIWIRLLFVLLLAGYGVISLVYVVMWIVIPPSYDLEEPRISRKMFRDPEQKALGGVAGGLSHYFGIDLLLVRILFIIFTFIGGLGLLVYVVLWIALPEARTLTDKMQMQGEPVTLSNIETTIKKNLNVKDGEENLLVKILLFPFRLLAALIEVLAKVIRPLVQVLKALVGVAITVFGIALFAFTVVMGVMLLGMTAPHSWNILGWSELQLPYEAISQTIPTFGVIVAIIVALVPSIFLLLLGPSVVKGEFISPPSVNWSLFIVFIAGMVCLGFVIPKVAIGFREEGSYKLEQTFDLGDKTAVLHVTPTGLDDYHVTTLNLEGYDGNVLKLVKTFEAQGNSWKEAVENAQMVDYNVTQQDSVLNFDSNITFHDDAVFKAQRLHMILYVPYHHRFKLDYNTWRLLGQYIEWNRRDGETWEFSGNRMLCVSCGDVDRGDADGTSNGYADFDALELSGFLNVHVNRSDRYNVTLSARGADRERYDIHQEGDRLYITYDSDDSNFWTDKLLDFDKVEVTVTMPDLRKMELKGAGQVDLTGFNTDRFDIQALGAFKINGNINADEITIDLTGASQLSLTGRGENMHTSLEGASRLSAYDYHVTDAYVSAGGASSAEVFVTGSLEIDEGVASSVHYRGDPKSVRKE